MRNLKPDYKSHWARNHDLLEKEELMPKKHSCLLQKMLHESQVLEDQINRFMIETEPKTFYIKGMKSQTSFWEIEFTQDVIQYVPPCFRFLTGDTRYDKYQNAEYVPSYMPNLNHIVLFQRYHQQNPGFGNNFDGIIKKYVHEGGKKMTFSSLNLLLKFSQKPKILDSSTHSTIESMFEFCYWNLPTNDSVSDVSCIDNFIYSKSKSVLQVWMTRKTLVKIIFVDKRIEKREILGNKVSLRSAKVILLSDNGHKVQSSKMNVWLTEEIADSVSENDVFNGVLANIIHPDCRLGRSIIIGKIGKNVTPNNMKSLVSIILWKMLQIIEDNSSPTFIGTVTQIELEITKIIQSNSKLFSAENFSSEMLGWTKDLPKKISQCVKELFPLFLEDDGKIYQSSPVLLGFIASHSSKHLEDREFLLNLVKLFDTVKVNSNFWGNSAMMKLRTSQPYSSIQSSSQLSTQKFLDNFPRLLNRMVYSRIFSQHPTNW